MCAIYLKHGDELVAMVEQPYEAEAVLQGLLADYPDLLAGDEDDRSQRRWLLVQRELGVAAADAAGDRWSIDHLFLDQDGVPTLVEVKRSSDTRIRREVVGQLLEYAASASASWAVERIRAAFEEREGGPDAATERLSEFLGENGDPEAFWETVAVNLGAGRLRLVFVADAVPSELRRIVEFLNEQMDRTEVLALEVRQYVERGGSRTTLVPRLIGKTRAARRSKGAQRATRCWTEPEILATIREHHSPESAGRLILLYEFLREQATRATFGSGKSPSVTFWLGEHSDPAKANPVVIGIWPADARPIAIEFRYVHDKRTPAELRRWLELLRGLPGTSSALTHVEAKDFRALAGFQAEEALPDDEALAQFKRVVIEAIRPPGASGQS
jgi:hypothetical protein